MFPYFYNICQKNFSENLNYFEFSCQKIKFCHQCIDKFKKITSEYTSKLNHLFKEEKKTLEGYEIIDDDDFQIPNRRNKTEKIKKKNENNNEKIFFFPFDKSIDRLQNFFVDLGDHLIEFSKALDNKVKDMEQYLLITKSEINWIKDDYTKQIKIFKSKFKQYENLNNKLNNKYSEVEKNLIDFCLERRIDGIVIDNNVNICFSNIVKEENEIIKKYDSLGDYENIFYNSIKEKVKSLQDFISSIFLKFDDNSKDIQNIFTNSFISPIQSLFREKNKKIKEENFESELRADLNILLNNKEKIDEKNLKLKLSEYNITVLESSIIIKEENKKQNSDEKKTKINKKEKNSEKKEKEIKDNNTINLKENQTKNIVLTDEEIFFIVQNIYEYKLINRNKYNLKIEEKKLKLKKIIKKLLNYEDKQKKEDNINDKDMKKEIISKEEIDSLFSEMKNEPYRNFFLLFLNNYRATGFLKISNEVYEYLTRIFSEISKHIYIIEQNDDKKEYITDFYSSKLIVILSQTFYTLKDGNKVYLSEKIKNDLIFHRPKFWKDLIKNLLENELKNVLGTKNKPEEEKIIKLKNDIYLAHILPFIGSMNGFNIEKKEMKNILGDLIKEYNMEDNVSNVIFNTIDNYN